MTEHKSHDEKRATLGYYWFVQYNPLYFTSALGVLLGVYLVTEGLEDWQAGQIALAGVTQAYELLLIVGAGVLFRHISQPRPAVILALLAVFFFYDPTFRTEGFASIGGFGSGFSLMWVLLLPVKLAALAFALRLEIAWSGYVMPVLGGMAVAAGPHLFRTLDVDCSTIHLFASWFGCGLLAAAVWLKPAIRSKVPPGEWGELVLQRSIRAAQWLWAVFYLYHLATWAGIYAIDVTLHHLVPFLVLIPLLARRELGIWAGAGAAIGLSLFEPSAVASTAILVSAALACRAWRERRARLWPAVILAAYVGLYTLGLDSFSTLEAKLWLNLLASTSLFALAWRLELPSAAAAGVLCVTPGAVGYIPDTVFEWGVWALSFGFVALICGVGFNWWTRNLRPPAREGAQITAAERVPDGWDR